MKLPMLRTLRVLRAASMASGLALSLACGSDVINPTPPPPPPPVVPGDLAVNLNNVPAGSEALILVLGGPSISEVRLTTGMTALKQFTGSGEVRIVIRGALRTGRLLTFHVPDINLVAQYTGRILDAATGPAGGYQSIAPAQFSVAIVR